MIGPPMRSLDSSMSPADITKAVIASLDGCQNERLRELMRALVRHLHAFAAEVGLTQEEWSQAIRVLTETGQITDARRQEFILWSDALGLSMLVDALEHRLPPGATESTVLGPFTCRMHHCASTAPASQQKRRVCRHGCTVACSTPAASRLPC